MTSIRRKDKPAEDSNDILKYASELALNKGKLERDISNKILQNIASTSPSGFNEYFKSQSLLSYVSNTYQNPTSVSQTIAFLHQVLKLKAETRSPVDGAQQKHVVVWLLTQFKAASNIELQENICTILLFLRNTPEFQLVAQKAQTMLQVVVTWLCTTDFINTEADVYNKHVNILVEFMLLLWNNFSAHLVLETLNHVFVRVSSPLFPSPPSPAVANVLHSAPSSLIWAAAPHITANATIKDLQLELALSRIVKWPLTMNTARWVVGLLQGLIEAKKFTVLARITITSVEPVLNQIWIERTSRGALHVLEHMLLGFQHAPDAFHLAVPKLTPLLHYLALCVRERQQKDRKNNIEDAQSTSNDSERPINKPDSARTTNHNGQTTNNDTDDANNIVKHAVVMHLAVPLPPPPLPSPTIEEPSTSPPPRPPTPTPPLVPFATPPSPTTPSSQDSSTPPPPISSSLPQLPTPSPSTASAPTPSQTIFLSADSPACIQVLEQLGRLVWVLFVHHMGHPELYAPLVAELTTSHISPPPDDETRAILLERAWTSLKDVKVDSEIKGRSAGSKGGLHNLGNILESTLFMTDQLRSRVLSLPPLSSKTPLPLEFQRLFAFLSSSLRDSWDPKALYKVYPEWYRSGLQQDSCEFGKYLLDQLDTELKGISSPISSIFEGRMLQTITCSECKSHSSIVETFWDLPLAFSGEANKQESVDGMLESFFLPETLEGSNQYSCSTCKELRNAEKSLCILEPPPNHLMLTLKRFAYDPQLKKQVKILKEIRYPEVITLPYNIIPEYSVKKQTEKGKQEPIENSNQTSDTTTNNNNEPNGTIETTNTEEMNKPTDINEAKDDNEVREITATSMEVDDQPPTKKTKITQNQATYILYGVIMHSGTSAERGHYYTYARSSKEASKLYLQEPPSSSPSPSSSTPSPSSSSSAPSSSSIQNAKKGDEGWMMFNDNQVRPSSFESFTSITRTFPTDVAYILFYARAGYDEELEKSIPTLIPSHLQSEIVADNKKFLEELEGQQKRASQRQIPYFSSTSRYPYDDEEDKGGFGGAGRRRDGRDRRDGRRLWWRARWEVCLLRCNLIVI